MVPTLHNGDYILVRKVRTLKPGLIYIISHGELGKIIKRLSHYDKGRYYFYGDNKSASVPLTLISGVEISRITGQALWALTRKGFKRL